MIILGLSLVASAADYRVADIESLGTGVSDVEITTDGLWCAAVEDGSSQVRVLDTESWVVEAYDPCGGGGIAGLAVWESGDTVRFYTGCEDATLGWIEHDDSGWAVGEDRPAYDGGAPLGLVAEDGLVYFIAQASEDGNPQIHVYDPDSGGVDDSGGYPVAFGYSGFLDVAASGNNAVVTHGGDNVSRVDLATGSPVQREQSMGTAQASDVIASSSGRFFIAAGPHGVIEMQTSDNDLQGILDSGDGLDDVSAILIDPMEGFFLAADSGRQEFVFFDYSGTPGDTESGIAAFPAESAGGGPTEMAALAGYAMVGTDAGELWVLTDRPWVQAGEPNPSAAVSGDEVEFSFVSDTAGEWSVLVGASGDSGGTELASGSVEADVAETVTLVIDDSYSEGDNAVRVVVKDSDGLTGHDVMQVNVDNPPSRVLLSDASVDFGDSQLTLSFEGVEDEDLAYYLIYITTTPFSVEDWPTGGPDFDGPDAIEAPVTVEAEPGADVIQAISPLRNGVTYYLAVRAYDEGGQEGPMSDIATGMPQETYSAAQLSGEAGGLCGTAAPLSGVLAALAGLFVVARRRRGLGLAAVVAVAGLCASPDARAADDSLAEHRARTHGTFSLGYGPIWLDDPAINEVFNQGGHQVLWLEVGPKIIQQLEVTGGLGFYQEMGTLVAEDGSSSGEHDMLTAWPVNVNARLLLDFTEEQILVPTVSVGGDYWLWRENWYVNPDVGGDGSMSGGKYGWHWAGTLNLLLDRIEPARASRLQTRTGIDDSYLFVQYRSQSVGDLQDGLAFSGEGLSFGLRLDY